MRGLLRHRREYTPSIRRGRARSGGPAPTSHQKPCRLSAGTSPLCLSRPSCVQCWVLEKEFTPYCGSADIVYAGVVGSGVLAKCLERVIDGDLSLGGEHALGLLDDEPGVQRLLQLFGSAALLL